VSLNRASILRHSISISQVERDRKNSDKRTARDGATRPTHTREGKSKDGARRSDAPYRSWNEGGNRELLVQWDWLAVKFMVKLNRGSRTQKCQPLRCEEG
jgi:hypothetical protein